MAPSTVLKRAPQSSTRQWKCTFCRKSHWASQSLVSNLMDGGWKDAQVSDASQPTGSGVGVKSPRGFQ